MSEAMIIHVLAGGELFKDIINATTTFMNQAGFLSLLRITALIGIVMVTARYLTSRDPVGFAKWVLAFMLVTQLVILPKTPVLIHDLSSQQQYAVANVPVVFAVTASVVTSIGYGLAQIYDMLFSVPGDLTYTQTGALFGARLIEATHEFRVRDPDLKDALDHYFRSCVVGDIRLNNKYSVGELANSEGIWSLISKQPSPLRMTSVNGHLVTCLEAATGANNLKVRLDAEIKKAYSFFGINLFGREKNNVYETLFETHLTSAFGYYQDLRDTSSNIFLQAMMINAMSDGISHYQTYTDGAAGVINHELTKSQVQQRWSWAALGQLALTSLPLLHTMFTILLFGVFPLVLAMSTLPEGAKIFMSYLQFFFSLQCWPVLFAILNSSMMKYGTHHSVSGGMTMANIEQLTQLHQDISSVAGYMMALVPFIANGLITNLSAAFNGLATSMTSSMQGAAMAAAGEATAASFGLGQTSFYNTTANNLSTNKHDSNWTKLHGLHSEQASTGVIKTTTGSGEVVFDGSPGMSHGGATNIVDHDAMTGSLNDAYETSKQGAITEGHHLQTAISNASHRMMQLSELNGHDLRLGEGVSSNDSSQYTKAISTMSHIAGEFSKRTGISKDEAFTTMTSAGLGGHAELSTDRSALGKIAKIGLGASGGVRADLKADRSSSSGDKSHEGTDQAFTSREASDFNAAYNVVSHFAQNHHFDDAQSKGAQLSNQLGADLREVETAGHNQDASLARMARVQEARSFVESHGTQVSTDLNGVFPAYVKSRVGESERDALFSHPGDAGAVQQLQSLGKDFIAAKREELISGFGGKAHSGQVDAFYHKEAAPLIARDSALGGEYQKNSEQLQASARAAGIGFDREAATRLQQNVQQHRTHDENKITTGYDIVQGSVEKSKDTYQKDIKAGQYQAKNGVVPFHAVDNLLEAVHLKETEE